MIDAIEFEEKHFRRDIGHFMLSRYALFVPQIKMQQIRVLTVAFRSTLAYSTSGVNIEEGNKLVESIKEDCASTLTNGCNGVNSMHRVANWPVWEDLPNMAFS